MCVWGEGRYTYNLAKINNSLIRISLRAHNLSLE